MATFLRKDRLAHRNLAKCRPRPILENDHPPSGWYWGCISIGDSWHSFILCPFILLFFFRETDDDSRSFSNFSSKLESVVFFFKLYWYPAARITFFNDIVIKLILPKGTDAIQKAGNLASNQVSGEKHYSVTGEIFHGMFKAIASSC